MCGFVRDKRVDSFRLVLNRATSSWLQPPCRNVPVAVRRAEDEEDCSCNKAAVELCDVGRDPARERHGVDDDRRADRLSNIEYELSSRYTPSNYVPRSDNIP